MRERPELDTLGDAPLEGDAGPYGGPYPQGGPVADEKRAPSRTPAEIENDLAAIRTRLATNVASLVDQVHPQRIKEREVANLKRIVAEGTETVKLQFVTANGTPRVARLAAIGAAVAGLAGFVVIVKVLGARRRSGPKA